MKLLVTFLILASASAFCPIRSPNTSPCAVSATRMGDMNAMCLVNTANYCLHNTCSLEDREALINTLEEQSLLLEQRLQQLRSRIGALAPRPYVMEVPHMRKSLPLNDIDMMCILNAAKYCVAEECSLDDKQGLVNRMAEQSQVLQQNLTEMLSLTRRLKSGMQANEEKDIASLMESIQSVLSMDVETANNEKILSGSFH